MHTYDHPSASSRYNIYRPAPAPTRPSGVKRSNSYSSHAAPFYSVPASYSKENRAMYQPESARSSRNSSAQRSRIPDCLGYAGTSSTSRTSSSSSSRQGRSAEPKPLRSSFKRSQSADKHVHFPDERPKLKHNHTWHAGDPVTSAPAFVVLPQLKKAAPPPPPPAPTPVVDMHPLFTPSRFHNAPISYDITNAPSPASVIDRKSHHSIPGTTLAQPATAPALPVTDKLVLRSSKLPWPVVVNPSPSRSRTSTAHTTSITNLDVLHAVHRTLTRRVTPEEWASLGPDSMVQRRVRRAYEKRCEKNGGWDGGVRRVDWLCGKTRLAGVEVDKHALPGAAACKLIFDSPK